MAFEDIATAEREHLARCVHEASHSVVAALYGGAVVAAEVYRGGPRTDPQGRVIGGLCDFTNDDTGTTVAHRSQIVAAGVAGESVWRFGPRPSIGQMNEVMAMNGLDARELRRLAGAFSAPLPPHTMLPLVLRCWPAVARLAHQLNVGTPVAHEQVCAAMGMPTRGNEMQRHAILQGGTVPRTLTPTTRHLAAV